MRRPPPPPEVGAGELLLGRHVHAVTFVHHLDTQRGSLSGSADMAADAFRRGDGVLVKSCGNRVRLTFTAHTAGGDTIYFETIKASAPGLGVTGGVLRAAAPKRPPAS